MSREEGRIEGREELLFAFVTTLQELHISRSDTLQKLKEKFSLTTDAAENYLSMYWK